MAQYDFATIDPYAKTGIALIGDMNSWRDAVHSQHKGASRPSYAVAGMQWIDDTPAPWTVNVYDGSQDIPVFQIDPTADQSILNAPTITLPSAAAASPLTGDVRYDSTNRALKVNGQSFDFLPRLWTTISKGTATSVSSVAFTNLSAYRDLSLTVWAKLTAANQQLGFQTSTNNGSSYLATNVYETVGYMIDKGTGFTGSAVTTTDWQFISQFTSGGATATYVHGRAEFMNFNQAANGQYRSICLMNEYTPANMAQNHNGGVLFDTVARNAFRIICSANMTEISYHLEGIRG